MPIAGASDFPNVLTGLGIQTDDEVAAGMNQLPIQLALVQYRCGRQTKLNFELAVTFLSVEVPDLFAIKVMASEVAGADKRIHIFAIGARRGGCVTPFIPHHVPALVAR